MNIISCKSCGVLLDKDQLHFPEEIWLNSDSYEPNLEVAVYTSNGFVSSCPCPVCKNKIPESE